MFINEACDINKEFDIFKVHGTLLPGSLTSFHEVDVIWEYTVDDLTPPSCTPGCFCQSATLSVHVVLGMFLGLLPSIFPFIVIFRKPSCLVNEITRISLFYGFQKFTFCFQLLYNYIISFLSTQATDFLKSHISTAYIFLYVGVDGFRASEP